jgi:tetratricopeptide (TPR) repeat protein
MAIFEKLFGRRGPKTAVEFYNRGVDYFEQGDLDRAIADYTEAVRLDPQQRHVPAYQNLAAAYLALGDFDRAVADATRLLERDPHNASALCLRAGMYDLQGEFDKAIADYTEAIRLHPHDVQGYHNRGESYLGQRDWDKAIADLTEAIRLYAQEQSPAGFTEPIRLHVDGLAPFYSQTYCSRGSAYAGKRDYGKAVSDFGEAVRLNPGAPHACHELAWLRATCPEAEFRDGRQAVVYATKACGLSDWREPTHLACLAAAYAEVGQFDEAVKWQKKALESPDFPDEEREDARSRLQLYEEGKPFRNE